MTQLRRFQYIMKLISLNCNHCGAPIQVPDDARYATCRFCESHLAVERLDGAWTTRVLLQIQEQAEVLSVDVDELKKELALEQLDRQWDQESRQHVDRSGATPNPRSFVMMGIVFSLAMVIMAVTFGDAVLWLLVIQLMVMFFGMAAHQSKRESKYLKALGTYEQKRAALLRVESKVSEPRSQSRRLPCRRLATARKNVGTLDSGQAIVDAEPMTTELSDCKASKNHKRDHCTD